MFEVLAFVYDNYLDLDACPELPVLHRTLNTLGFAHHEVETALLWLEDLKSAARRLPMHPVAEKPALLSTAAVRALTTAELTRLGVAGWGFLAFLTSIGTLGGDELELVMERAMAAPGEPLSLNDLKLIVMMVFWGLAREPDALVLDELCEDHTHRLPH
jgi:Smg protein